MKLNFLKASIIIVAVIILSPSCKKDETTTSSKYLKGTLSMNYRSFLLAGSEYTFTPSGVTHPDGESIGYYFTVSPNANHKRDTTLSLTFRFAATDSLLAPGLKKDSLTTYTVSAVAFAKGYSSSSLSRNVTVIAPGFGPKATIQNSGVDPDEGEYITDDRDGKYYYYKTVGLLDWFQHNLGAEFDDKGNPFEVVNYYNSPACASVIGGFYSHEAALKACPEGWHLPTDAEFAALASGISGKSDIAPGVDWDGIAGKFMTYASFNREPLWEYWPDMQVPSQSNQRFNALPYGYIRDVHKLEAAEMRADDTTPYYGTSYGSFKYAAFWTADHDPQDPQKALYRYIVANDSTVHLGSAYEDSIFLNVRCCRDTE